MQHPSPVSIRRFPTHPRRRMPLHASFISPGNPNPHRGYNYLLGDPGAEDPLSPLVIFLSSFDGNSINEVNGAQHVAAQNVSFSATESKFGGQSLFCTPVLATDYMRWATQTNVTEINGSLTLEGWIFPTAFGSQRNPFGMYRDFAGQTLFTQLSAAGVLSCNVHGATISTSRILTLNDWNYFAFCISNTTARVFLSLPGEVNTTLESTTPGIPQPGTTIAGTIFGAMNEISLGVGTSRPMAGYIDEIRLTASAASLTAAARYSAAFPTPTAPFPYP